MSERPVHPRPRRLADWINPTGEKKEHSLIDKVYKRKNLEIAWEKVKANHGSGGIDGESVEKFVERLEERFQPVEQRLLTDPIVDRRNPKLAMLPRLSRFRDQRFLHGSWAISISSKARSS